MEPFFQFDPSFVLTILASFFILRKMNNLGNDFNSRLSKISTDLEGVRIELHSISHVLQSSTERNP